MPLSTQALAILREMAELRCPDGGYVFSYRSDRQLGDDTMRHLVKRLGYGAGSHTVHGGRSSFRDYCKENGVPYDVGEHAPAHQVGSQVERAYARSTMLDERRELMQRWADFVCGVDTK